jgi:hypothetical protein
MVNMASMFGIKFSLSKTDRSTRIIVIIYHSVTIRPLIPMNMIGWRIKVFKHIAGVKRDRWIGLEARHGCDLIGEIHHDANSPGNFLLSTIDTELLERSLVS